MQLAGYPECINFMFDMFIKSLCCVKADLHCTLHSFDKNQPTGCIMAVELPLVNGAKWRALDYTVAICIRRRAM